MPVRRDGGGSHRPVATVWGTEAPVEGERAQLRPLERASDWLPASLSFTSPVCPNDARTRAMDASTTYHWCKRCLERAGLSTKGTGYLHPGLDRLSAAMKQVEAEVVSSKDARWQPDSR
jgi:hypothetical protein